MLLQASAIRNDDVCTSDGKKLGTVVNVIFEADSTFPMAYILVFPHEKNWFLQQISENWGGIATSFIERNLPELPKEWDEIKKRGTGEAQRVWDAYYKANEQKRQLASKICYLILVSEIANAEPAGNRLTLKQNRENIRDDYCYIGEPQVSDILVPFYETLNIPVRENLLPITLNLSPIFQRLRIRDPNGNPSLIHDVQLDTQTRFLSALIVQVGGKDAGDYFVNPEDFNFATLTTAKPFSQYPKL